MLVKILIQGLNESPPRRGGEEVAIVHSAGAGHL